MGEHPGQKEQQTQRPKGKMEVAPGTGGMQGSSSAESMGEDSKRDGGITNTQDTVH